MSHSNKLTPEAVVSCFKDFLGPAVLEDKIITRAEGSRKRESIQIWIVIDKAAIKAALNRLVAIDFPHLTVISGCDIGESVELNYHFYIYYGVLHGEYNVTFKTLLPKNDLTIDTITEILPGALTSEREKQEFFGITVKGIPDSRRMFLPKDFPVGLYPWRKDDTGIQESMVKQLHAVGKPDDSEHSEVLPDGSNLTMCSSPECAEG